MVLVKQGERSAAAVAAAVSAVAAISVCAVTAGPLSESSAWRLAASSLSADVTATIQDVLVATRAAVRADRSDIVVGRQTIRDTRHDAVRAIGASVLTGSVGDGQIKEIAGTAGAAIDAEHQANAATRTDISQTRTAAAADVRTIILDNHDGTTVEAVRAILDTAKMDNAMTRSTIAQDVMSNKSIRHATASDVVTLRRSARAGEITRAEAAQQISSVRRDAHQSAADNRAQVVSARQQITATRREAAKDVAQTVHDGRKGQ